VKGPLLASLALGLALGAASLARAEPLPGAPALAPELARRLEAARVDQDTSDAPRTRHVTPEHRPRFTNRLILETSPYLLQHAHNPVNWYAWGEEALSAARELDRPIFLSIGYSTCHWCHVMEEESFEDLEVAELLNRHFVAIKVDREERPDLDGLYMAAVQSLTGRGGWPLTAFLTPDGRPFYGGTYFPPRDGQRGRSRGLLSILRRIHERYAQDRASIHGSASRLSEMLRESLDPPMAVGVPGPHQLRSALAEYRRGFDHQYGGLRSRTKFPSRLPLPFLLRVHRRTGDPEPLRMAQQTLDAMQHGGIYDHVGGGFHRYTIEPSWTIPHFEKMLYDNALLASAYLEAYQLTQEQRYARVARDVLDYLEREMTAPQGTFYAATDADSEGEEGRFYVWTPQQLQAAVGAELNPLARAAYGVNEEGNFEGGATVLRRDLSAKELASRFDSTSAVVERDLGEIRERMRRARSKRIPPHTDRKQIVAWNALAISAFARAGFVLRKPALVERGAEAARTLLEHARPGGLLARYLMDSVPHGTGMLEDHAFLIAALLDLLETTAEPRWLDEALGLQQQLDERFFDANRGGYYLAPTDAEQLLAREKPAHDGALPSGNSIAALNLLRLTLLTTDDQYRARAEMTVRAFSEVLDTRPTSLNRMLEAVDFLSDRPKEILIVTPNSLEEAEPYLRELVGVFLPNRVSLAVREDALPPLAERIPWLKHKRALGGKPTAYVCENGVCDLPARDVATFARQIRAKPAPYPDATSPRSSGSGPGPPRRAQARHAGCLPAGCARTSFPLAVQVASRGGKRDSKGKRRLLRVQSRDRSAEETETGLCYAGTRASLALRDGISPKRDATTPAQREAERNPQSSAEVELRDRGGEVEVELWEKRGELSL
jgi:uncharacterized protein YyaL (SSP411 family)